MADGQIDARDVGTSASLEELGAFYDRLRSYTEHQDNLINQRLTWYLTLQGFVFTTFGFSVQKQIDVLSGSGDHLAAHRIGSSLLILGFGLILAIASILISKTVHKSITAAVKALSCLRHTWLATVEDYGGIEYGHTREGYTYIKPLFGRLPFLHGGGNELNISRGHHTALNITIYISGAWFLISVGYIAGWLIVMSNDLPLDRLVTLFHKLVG